MRGFCFFIFSFSAGLVSAQDSLKSIPLDEVIITGKPDVVLGNNSFWIQDYEFHHNQIFVSAYKDDPSSPVLFVLDSAQTIISSKPVPEPPESFFTDCFGSVHLLSDMSAFQVKPGKDSLSFYTCSRSQFELIVRPFVGKAGAFLYGQFYNSSRLSVAYYYYNMIDKSSSVFYIASDSSRAEMLEDEPGRMKRLSDMMEANMGSPGIGTLLRHGSSFAQNILYKKPVDAHIIVENDSIYVFDFFAGQELVYALPGKLVRINKTEFSGSGKWEKNLLRDKANGNLYTSYLEKGYTVLRKVNPVSGLLEGKWKIGIQWVKNVKVFNGHAYFIYRPFESLQTKYLYKIPLGEY
jgi:hypothetical protein